MIGGEVQYGRRVNFHDGFNVNDSSAVFVQVRLHETVRIVRRINTAEHQLLYSSFISKAIKS
jgi:hypothetical protein